LEDEGVNGMIIRCIFRKWAGGGMDWIDLAQNTDTWWVPIKVVMNLRAP
jgi:hypothetical protein